MIRPDRAARRRRLGTGGQAWSSPGPAGRRERRTGRRGCDATPRCSRAACRGCSLEARRVAATAGARHPRPPAGRARRELLAVPALRDGRSRRSASTGAARRATTSSYVREREWEAAHTVWLWVDRSASMGYRLRPRAARRRSSARSCSASRWPTLLVEAASASAISASSPPRAAAPSSSAWPRRIVADRAGLSRRICRP